MIRTAERAPNDTGWIFGLANFDDVAGIGDADNADVIGTHRRPLPGAVVS